MEQEPQEKDLRYDAAWAVSYAISKFEQIPDKIDTLTDGVNKLTDNEKSIKDVAAKFSDKDIASKLMFYMKIAEEPAKNIMRRFNCSNAFDIYMKSIREDFSDEECECLIEDARRITDVCQMIDLMNSITEKLNGLADDMKEFEKFTTLGMF